jgi:3-dehydrosphinganine reductase
MKSFDHKLALITGGSSGIGLAVAKQLAALGANVTILSRSPEKLVEAQKEIEQSKVNPDQSITTLTLDVSDYAAVKSVLEVWMKSNGTPDLVVNSAGVVQPGKFEELDINLFKWMMDIDYFGIVNVLKVVVPGMIQRRSGYIVNISSMAGYLGTYGYSAYGGAKFAVRGLSDVLRSELKLYGIQVSVAFPPDTETPQLEYEKPFKPAITKELAGTAGAMSADAVAAEIISGIQHNRYTIKPGFENKLFYHLTNFIGDLTYKVMDMMVADAVKKTR